MNRSLDRYADDAQKSIYLRQVEAQAQFEVRVQQAIDISNRPRDRHHNWSSSVLEMDPQAQGNCNVELNCNGIPSAKSYSHCSEIPTDIDSSMSHSSNADCRSSTDSEWKTSYHDKIPPPQYFTKFLPSSNEYRQIEASSDDNRSPVCDNQSSGNDNRLSVSDSRLLVYDNRSSGNDNRSSVSDNQLPVYYNRSSGNDNRLPVYDNRSPGNDNRLIEKIRSITPSYSEPEKSYNGQIFSPSSPNRQRVPEQQHYDERVQRSITPKVIDEETMSFGTDHTERSSSDEGTFEGKNPSVKFSSNSEKN